MRESLHCGGKSAAFGRDDDLFIGSDGWEGRDGLDGGDGWGIGSGRTVMKAELGFWGLSKDFG